MVLGSPSWVGSDARVQWAIEWEKNSDLIRRARSGKSLLEGSGAKEGGLDRCAGLRLKGEVDGEFVRGVRCPRLPGRDQFLESDVRPVRLDPGGHRLRDGVEPQ